MTKSELHTRISRINARLDTYVKQKNFRLAVRSVMKREQYMKVLIKQTDSYG